MADIDDLFTDPNAGAYEAEETRVGPPLAYVGEKLRYSVEHAHRAARGTRASSGEEARREADAAFRYGVTAYLGLYNMLGMLSDHRKLDALLELDEDSFEVWLDTDSVRGLWAGDSGWSASTNVSVSALPITTGCRLRSLRSLRRTRLAV